MRRRRGRRGRRRAAVPDLRGKRCLITGAASGIGRATALAAAAHGAELFLTDLHEEPLARVVEEVRAAGGTVAHAAPADVADHEAVVALGVAIHAAHGAMDVVMNVAGIATWGTIDRLEHRHWRRVVDVNLMGPISVLECFVPPMIAAGRGGQIVNVSSAAGLFGLPWHAPYSATKFGLRGVSEVLRFDLRRHGIGVTLVCPGAVRTPLTGTVTIVGVDKERPDDQSADRALRAARRLARARRGLHPRRGRAQPLHGLHLARHPLGLLAAGQVGEAVRADDARGEPRTSRASSSAADADSLRGVAAAIGWGGLAASSLLIGALAALARGWSRRLIGLGAGVRRGRADQRGLVRAGAGGERRAAASARSPAGLALGGAHLLRAGRRRRAARRAGPRAASGIPAGRAPAGRSRSARSSTGSLSSSCSASAWRAGRRSASGCCARSSSRTCRRRSARRARCATPAVRRARSSACGRASLSAARSRRVGGYALGDAVSGELRAAIDGFAAGALLVMLVDSMIPDATQDSGRQAGLVTVLGFALAAALSIAS